MARSLQFRDYAQLGNWVSLPEPKTMTIEHFDVDSDSSGRNTKGFMVRDRVAKKRKISCTWEIKSAADLVVLESVADYTFIRLQFFDDAKDPSSDLLNGSYTSGVFYVGDRNAEVYSIKKGTALKNDVYLFKTFEVHFIER